MRQRLISALFLVPLGIAAIYYGSWYYFILMVVLVTLAAKEYADLFRAGGHQPNVVLVAGGTLAIVINQSFDLFGDVSWSRDPSWLISSLLLVSMIFHLFQYERGRDNAATDFAITVSGFVYFGLLGAYLVLLRQLPEGLWWVMLALPAIWFADSGAYFYGRVYGRRKFSPRLSPKKTWEGYIAGIVTSIIGTTLFAILWRIPAGQETAITPFAGALLGLVISIVAPLGDLGESMIKRQFGVKDSSHLIPGHGGAFDRIDSWLWAGMIGYYIIVWFLI
ncbi:MAG: phosphatidate cytidylyltransferase [Anaerolineae bacterium]|nr:phosphatidate cytidylyltransferase [Anaerolineae bacterium]